MSTISFLRMSSHFCRAMILVCVLFVLIGGEEGDNSTVRLTNGDSRKTSRMVRCELLPKASRTMR
jgi:hypothetical protein